MSTMLRTVTARIEAMKKLPHVLEIQQHKLLIVMKQVPDEVSSEDELLVKLVVETLQPASGAEVHWDDSKASECVEATLEKHAFFDLCKYLDCAENVCDAFSDKTNSYPEVYSSMEYVLTHAREFGRPDAAIFETEATDLPNYRPGSARLKEMEEIKDSKHVLPAKALIGELKIDCDEAKFRCLNAYITSFVLVILRRSLLNRTDCIFYATRALVIEAYLNTSDQTTEKNLHKTCVKYMEWYDMQMPYLFCKALDVWKIEADFLWDILSSVEYNRKEIALSLIKFGTEYYEKYLLQKAHPMQRQRWFPYCRLFDRDCHRRLSNNDNVYICAVLVKLIEKKAIHEELAIKCTTDLFKYEYSGVKGIVEELCVKIGKKLLESVGKK